ncbi:MAG: DUF3006 domain-containing protein [Clostridia bacterium]|nr:DUF3006 domain-containing protein [Clostridia bacterium]
MELEVKTLKNSAKTSDNIGVSNTLSHSEKNKYVQSFITQLFNKLNINKKIEEENSLKDELEIIYVIDRFEGNYAVCENRETEEMKNINIYELPEDIKEGDVLRYKNGEYSLDKEIQQTIEERIQEKTKNIFED